jgi:sigma-E factor negative regulatory protein RseC
MMEQRARVVGTEGGFALVEAAPAGGCASCGMQGGCGVSKLGKLLPQRTRVLRVPNQLGARPGDDVTLGVPDDALLATAAAAYLPPLAGLVGGATLAAALATSDLWPMLGAGAGLLLGLAASRLLSQRWQARHAPRMVSRHAATAAAPVVFHRRAESDQAVS